MTSETTATANLNRGRGNTKELAFKRTETGCLIPINHKPQPNGYVRIVATRFGKPGRDYLHRLMYLEAHGPDSIPPGWELDHRCHRRDCCEPRHLWPIPAREHRYLSMMERFDEQKETAYLHWLAHSGAMPIADIAAAVGVGSVAARRWIREAIEQDRKDLERWATLAA